MKKIIELNPDRYDISISTLYRDFSPRYSREETVKLVEPQLKSWYHSMYLGHGLMIEGMRNPLQMLAEMQLPEHLRNKSVLDIGCAEGFFSFEAEARGAQRVQPIDLPGGQWNHGNTIRFNTAGQIYASGLKMKEIDFLDLNEDFGVFDIVFFFGVLYHLRDPFLALRKIRRWTGEMLFLETHVACRQLPEIPAFGQEDPPYMVFYEKGELAGDASNWWSPNLNCLTAMLRAAGFKPEIVSWQKNDWQGRAIVKAKPA